MDRQKMDDVISMFSLSLVIVACGILVYFLRDSSITGYVTRETSSFNITWAIMIGILAMISIFISLALGVHKLNQEVESHKKAIVGHSTNLDLNLASYVLKAKRNGFSDEQIISKLTEIGWNKAEIKKYLNNNLR
jgi:cytosine/uracil/thiamine/allantoin permease